MRHRAHHVRLVEEHHGLAETHAGSDQLDDFLAAVRRPQRKFDLTENYDVEAAARVAAVNQHGAARCIDLYAARRYTCDLIGTELSKHRQVDHEIHDVG